MTITQFIEKAISGGWEDAPPIGTTFKVIGRNVYFDDEDQSRFAVAEILMNSTAWKAVGKVEGWRGEQDWFEFSGTRMPEWLFNMHRMIDALAEGKTIEAYLETL